MRWTVGALTGAAVLVLAVGCGTAPASTPPPGGAQTAPQGGKPGGAGAQPTPLNVNVADALKTANKEFELLSGGDWAAAWQLWHDTAKKAAPKKVFVEVNSACPAALKQQYQLQDVKPVSNQLIELAFRRGDIVEHGSLRPAGKTWVFDPGAQMLAEYANGAKEAIAKRKAGNRC